MKKENFKILFVIKLHKLNNERSMCSGIYKLIIKEQEEKTQQVILLNQSLGFKTAINNFKNIRMFFSILMLI